MTNFEKYKDLFEEWSEKDQIAILNNKPRKCFDANVKCDNCNLRKPGISCSTALVKWLYEEYKEEPTLSKNAYYFLKSFPKSSRIKIDTYNNKFYLGKSGFAIYETEYFGNLLIPTLPSLKENIWYDVSDILKWKVEEDD